MTATYRVQDGLYVNLTNRCPCACTFCIRQNGSGAYGSDSLWLEREPTADDVRASIGANFGDCKELVFCGYGEPTERLDVLLEIAAWFRMAYPEVPIRVNTNGLSDLIAGEPTAHRFKGLVDTVSISLNAPTAEGYAALCRPKFGDAEVRRRGQTTCREGHPVRRRDGRVDARKGDGLPPHRRVARRHPARPPLRPQGLV